MLAIHATWSGAVFHKVVRLEHDVSQQTMDRAQNYLNEQFGGLSRKAMRQLTNEELKNAEFPSGTLHHRAFQLADLALPRQLEPDLDLIVGGHITC